MFGNTTNTNSIHRSLTLFVCVSFVRRRRRRVVDMLQWFSYFNPIKYRSRENEHLLSIHWECSTYFEKKQKKESNFVRHSIRFSKNILFSFHLSMWAFSSLKKKTSQITKTNIDNRMRIENKWHSTIKTDKLPWKQNKICR